MPKTLNLFQFKLKIARRKLAVIRSELEQFEIDLSSASIHAGPQQTAVEKAGLNVRASITTLREVEASLCNAANRKPVQRIRMRRRTQLPET